jgi:hypothetical protein
VQSTNYLKITNDGDKPTTSVVIDFTESAFAGLKDKNFTIPIDGNVQFAWQEGGPNAVPSGLNFTFLPASASGSVTTAFTAKGNVIYVAYRIVKLPAVLDAQSYGASFTVTEI